MNLNSVLLPNESNHPLVDTLYQKTLADPFQHDENKFIHSLNDLLPLGFQELYSFLAGIMCRYAVLAYMC